MRITNINLDKEKLSELRNDLMVQGKELYDDKERFYKLAFFAVGITALTLLIVLIIIGSKKDECCCDCDCDDYDDYDYDYYDLVDFEDDYALEEDFAE